MSLDTSRFLILNVNDNPASRYLVSKMLRNAGFRVVEAVGGDEALVRIYEEPQPDIVVLDVRMPKIDGFEVCRRIKSDSHTERIKVLHSSATYVTADKRVEGLEAGADGYLAQPFEPEELIATVRSLARLQDAEGELRDRARRLADADRLKDEFLAMLAHELRNPLASITAAVPLLRRHPARDAIEERSLDALERQSRQLGRLIEDLLDVSRVSRGRIVLRREPIELGELLSRLIVNLRERLTAHGRNPEALAEQRAMEETSNQPRQDFRSGVVGGDGSRCIELMRPEGPLVIDGDVTRLEQVFTNLLDNAIKYSGAEGTIVVEVAVVTSEDGALPRARVTVTDDGVGIAAEVLPYIFELFTQAEATIDRSAGGLGIGLTLARRLVELHGGHISVHSDGVGHGSVFAVELPLETERARLRRQSAAPEIGDTVARRVAVVEDNADTRELVTMMLEQWGHEVRAAPDGTEGLLLLTEWKPEVAFVDLGLPGIEGYELARRVRLDPGCGGMILVALSGYSALDQRTRALDAGFDVHIAKPAEARQLRAILAAPQRRDVRNSS